MKKILFLVFIFTTISLSAQRYQDHKLIGYIPGYSSSENVDYANLTHAIYSFLVPQNNGTIASYPDWELQNFNTYLEKTTADSIVRGIALGGAGVSFNHLASHPEALSVFADTLVEFCQFYDFKLVDVDWEGLGSTEERDNFSTLIDTLVPRLKGKGIELSITLTFGNFWGQYFANEALQKADWLQIMVYDQTGTWGASPFGNHASLDHFVAAEEYWVSRGFTKDKLVMGIPFYGRQFTSSTGGVAPGVAYRDIVAQFPMLADSVNQTPNEDYTFFNGPDLVVQKTKYVIDSSFAGVMIWDMNQDATGYKSLHHHIVATLNETALPTRKTCSTTAQGLKVNLLFNGDALDSLENITVLKEHVSYGIDRFGKPDKVATFVDSDTLIFNQDEVFDIEDHTFSFWVKFSQYTANPQILFNKWGEESFSYVAFLYENQIGIQYFAHLGEDSLSQIYITPTLIKANHWYHIAFTQSFEKGVDIYINGLPVLHDDTQFSVIPSKENALIIGQSEVEDYPFFGALDEFKLYNRKLSECEIDGLFYHHYANETTVITSIEELENEPIHVYPNPVHQDLMIEGDFLEARLVNLLGETVLSFTSSVVDVSHLSRGVYILVCFNSNGTKTTKRILKGN